MSPARLRGGEWLAGAGAIMLLVALLALHWYAATGRGGWWSYPPLRPRRVYTYPGHDGLVRLIGPRTGWAAIPTLRWFVLASVALGLLLALTQAASDGPALPVTLDLLGTIVAGLTTILLFIRLASTGAPLRFGAVLGLLACAAVTGGAYRAVRTEQGVDPADPESSVELVTLLPGPTGDLH